MTRLPRWTSACRLGLALLPTLALAEPPSAAAAEPGRDAGLEFVRVTVPAERLREVPLDGGRLIPMPLKDFDRAVAGLLPEAAARRPRPLADAARYVLAIDDRGRLSGRLEFDLGAAAAAVGASVPVGDLSVQRAMLRSDDGVGEAVVFGMPGGRVAVKTPSPGTYACDLACPPSAAGEFRLPLVAALVTRLDLRLPETLKPVVANRGAGVVVVSRPEGEGAWRIDLAGADAIDLAIVPREDGQPRVRCWNRIVVRGRQVDVAVRIVPEAAWRTGPIRLRGDLRLEVIGGRSAAAAAEAVPVAGEADRIDVEVPPTLAGTLVPIDVWGVADAALDAAFMVPTIRPPPERWAGGGATLVVDPAFAVANLDAEECLVVAPSAADRWHVPAVGPTVSGAAATIHLEQQSAAARATATIEPRVPRLDTCRVTTLELSPGAVLGRAACAVGVPAGEAFVITGRVAPEWFIDSVEPVEWPTTAAGDGQGKREGEGEGEDAEQRLPVVERDRTLDWRVLRTESANELRIGLAEAATPARPLGLRITGHRRGVPIGGEVPTGDLDMVRLDGETAESSLVDYRVGPDAVIELDGRPMGVEPADERLAVLAEPGAPRGRIRGGTGGGTGVARLVRRRPPLEADVLVQLVARDSRITESLTVSCRPDAGAVDSVVVRVSEPLGDAVDWTLVDPPAGTLYARRLEPGGTSADDSLPGQESWLVEFRPVVAGPVTFRATRTRPFTGAVAAPLAWVDGATEARGTVVVRGAGGTRPTVLNRGLAERPPQIPDDRSAAVVTELSYGAAADLPRFPESGAVVVSPPEVAEARAWVWREATTAWCHDSGAIECETRFDIENRGRTEVALTVPGGLRLDEVSIDGEPAPFDVPSEAGGTTSVPLPAGRGRIELHVRGVAVRETALGAWRIDPVACGIDVPVLDRDRVVKLPADLDLISPGREGAAGDGWVERLFDAGLARPAAAAVEPVSTEAGFRTVAVAPATSGRGLFVVRRRLVSTAAIGVAGIAAAALAWAVRRPLVPGGAPRRDRDRDRRGPAGHGRRRSGRPAEGLRDARRRRRHGAGAGAAVSQAHRHAGRGRVGAGAELPPRRRPTGTVAARARGRRRARRRAHARPERHGGPLAARGADPGRGGGRGRRRHRRADRDGGRWPAPDRDRTRRATRGGGGAGGGDTPAAPGRRGARRHRHRGRSRRHAPGRSLAVRPGQRRGGMAARHFRRGRLRRRAGRSRAARPLSRSAAAARRRARRGAEPERDLVGRGRVRDQGGVRNHRRPPAAAVGRRPRRSAPRARR